MGIENNANLIYIDDLTGLYNRRYLFSQLPKEIQLAKEGQYPLWLFMFDVDSFKMINDTYGHLCGDAVLKEIAFILKDNTKTEDAKIRYAGDEFTVILPRMEEKYVLNVAERLTNKIRTHHFKDARTQKEIHLSISLGVAGFPKDATGATELIELADKSLYVSKEKGKDCVSSASEVTPELFWKKDLLERFPCRTFIDRKSEISLLKSALGMVQQAKGSIFLVSGELGAGKTRLLEEFEKDIIKEGAICWRSRCSEKYIIQPYHSLGIVLSEYLIGLNDAPDKMMDNIPSRETGALFTFLPALASLLGKASVVSEKIEESVLKSALIKLLLNISKIKPLGILYDDAHFMDRQSLDVILDVTASLQSLSVLVILAYQPEETLKYESELCPFYEILKTGVFKTFKDISIKGLSLEEVKEMVCAIFLNFSADVGFFKLIFDITKGSPLFTEELLKYLIEKEYIFYRNGKWNQKEVLLDKLPSSVEEVVKCRIGALSDEMKEMIVKAAVIGEDFQIDMLSKFGSEDRGYILDIMETVKKVGLIYENSSKDKDEFSFATSQARKVLFDLAGGKHTKNLFLQLGRMEEDIHSDNLASIASELCYNFKKAQDLEKTEHYAKLAKEGTGIIYDRAVRYAKTLLEEKAEEASEQEINRKAWLVVPEVIRSLYIASVYQNLYPPQNAMRVQFVEDAYARLCEVLLETEDIVISFSETNVIVNKKKVGKELTGFFAGAFIALLKNNDLDKVCFKRGLDRHELTFFIEIFGGVKEKEDTFTESFKKSGVVHIQVTENAYSRPKKGPKEKEELEEVMLVDYLLGKFSLDSAREDLPFQISSQSGEIARALEQFGEEGSKKSGQDKQGVKAQIVARGIQKMGKQFMEKGKGSWEQYKESLNKVLSAMEPELRSDILSYSLNEETQEKNDVIKELSDTISNETIVEVVAGQYAKKDSDLGKMKKLIERFFPLSGEKGKLKQTLQNELLHRGASEDECDFIFGNKTFQGLTPEERIDKILSSPPDKLLKMLSQLDTELLIDDLMTRREEAKAMAIVERLFEILIQDPSRYILIGNILNKILNIVVQKEHKTLLIKFINMYFDTCSKSKVCSGNLEHLLTPYLDNIVGVFLNVPRLDLVKSVIEKYISEGEKPPAILEAIDKISTRMTEELVRRIKNSLDWSELQELLVLLYETTTPHLIEKGLFEEGVPSGEYFEAYLMRRVLGKILSEMPLDILLSSLKKKLQDPRDFIIKNLIELIRSIQKEAVVEVLTPYLRHPDVVIRKKIIFCLGKRKEYQSAKLLGIALKDEDRDVRHEALNYLKERKDSFAMRVIKECLHGTDLPPDIREGLSDIVI